MIAAALLLFVLLSPFSAHSETITGTATKVRTPVGNLHTQPSDGAPVIDVLKQGDAITPLYRQGEWYAVKLPDQRLGWIHQSLVQGPTAVAATDETSPQMVSPDSTPVESDDTTETPKPTDQPPEVQEVAAEEPFEVMVNTMGGRIRETPSLDAAVKFVLGKGARAFVTAKQEKWYFIRTSDNRNGWAHQMLFDRLPPAVASPDGAAATVGETGPSSGSGEMATASGTDAEFTAALNVPRGRVRKGPSLDAEILFTLSRGETVTVADEEGDWYEILTQNGRTGWSHRKLFTRETARRITAIGFKTLENGDEEVSFTLSDFFYPNTFALDDERIPKVVCDFPDARPNADIAETIPVNGRFVQQLRVGIHGGEDRKTRVVVDLNPEKRYNVEQLLYKKTRRYTLTFKTLAASETAKQD